MTSQEVISRLKAEIERRKQSLRAGICSEDAFTKEQKREMLVAREEIDRFNRILDLLGAEEKENLIMANSPQLKEQKPAWSDEDEEMLNLTKTQLRILQSHLSYAHGESMTDMEYSSLLLQIEKCVSWLDIRFKSFRPSSKLSDVCYGAKGDPDPAGVWKPSEEQMDALLWCAAHLGGADHRVLAELYEHLKKLM